MIVVGKEAFVNQKEKCEKRLCYIAQIEGNTFEEGGQNAQFGLDEGFVKNALFSCKNTVILHKCPKYETKGLISS